MCQSNVLHCLLVANRIAFAQLHCNMHAFQIHMGVDLEAPVAFHLDH